MKRHHHWGVPVKGSNRRGSGCEPGVVNMHDVRVLLNTAPYLSCRRRIPRSREQCNSSATRALGIGQKDSVDMMASTFENGGFSLDHAILATALAVAGVKLSDPESSPALGHLVSSARYGGEQLVWTMRRYPL
jgi:hypothetical protein